jgi:ribosomal protein S12 methylthiotransferase accessory factor
VYFNWDRTRFADLPLTNWLNYAGIAAGQTREQALVSGIEELIERDTTMIWWLNRHPLPALRPPQALEQIWRGRPQENCQRAWAMHLPNEFDIPVIAGVVEHTEEQLLTIGFACRPNPLQATLKAWSEALILEESAYDLTQREGRTYQSVAAGWLPDVLKPWRADRMYLDDYRADFRDVKHLLMQLQLALDPRLIAQIRPWIDVAPQQRLGDLSALPDRSLATYRQRLESRGYEVFAIYLTLPDIALTGMHVVRVIIPGLAPNTPAAFPPLGRGRIQHMAVQLGWRHTPLSEDGLNYFPMPHA